MRRAGVVSFAQLDEGQSKAPPAKKKDAGRLPHAQRPSVVVLLQLMPDCEHDHLGWPHDLVEKHVATGAERNDELATQPVPLLRLAVDEWRSRKVHFRGGFDGSKGALRDVEILEGNCTIQQVLKKPQ